MSTCKVILVDDQASYRKTIKNVLQIIGGVEVIGEAENGQQYLDLLTHMKPDVTFMDIEMPVLDGIQTTKKAIEQFPNLVIIGLSLYENEKYIDNLIAAGAKGYLLKLSNNYDLLKTIVKYPLAEVFFSERIKKKRGQVEEAVGPKTILIVDDFETNTIVVESALKSAGYNVLKGLCGLDGVRHAMNTDNKIDLIVADFNMPGQNGAEMIVQIKQIDRYANIPSLILSSDKDSAKKMQAKAAGATGWIFKPFQLNKFLRIIERTLA